MDELLRDVKHGLRLMLTNRGFSVSALATIALGVGGTAAVFSLVYGVLFRPLPFREPQQLVRMWEVHPGAQAPIPGHKLSGPTYRQWPASSDFLETVGAFGGRDYTVTAGGDAQRLRGTRVTPSLFQVLGVSPTLGRLITDADAAEGAQPVVVLAHHLWQQRFASDPAAVGKPLTIDGVSREVIGVMPPRFAFPEQEVGLPDDRREISLYTPLSVAPTAGTKVIDYTDAVARLKPGATIAQVEAEGTSYARRIERPLADLVFGRGGQVEVRVRTLSDHMTMRVRPALVMMAAGVTFVLLIASANVINLFLSRGIDRGREMAVRSALGAGRMRLIRQLFTEAVLMSLLGGALGTLVGWALVEAVPLLAPADFPRLHDIGVDARFLIVAGLAAIFVGAVSGLTPAITTSRVGLTSIHAGAPRTVGTSGRHLRRLLLGIESTLAVIVLVCACLVARSFAELVRVDPGYDPANVLTADVRLAAAGGTDVHRSQLAASIVARLRTVPGVRGAGAGDMAPFGSMLSGFGFKLPGATNVNGQPVTATALRAIITPGYAEALDLELRDGRFFREDDLTSAIRPMIVNETFATTYFRDGRAPIGRRFTGLFPNWLGAGTVVEIVGVVKDVLPANLDARPESQIFVAQGGRAYIGHMTLVVKTDEHPTAAAPLVRDIVRQMAPGATVERMGPLTAKISASVGEPRFTAAVLVGFALLALALASTGLYGVLSYHIAQRRREIGVRVALGATPRHLIIMILREGLTTTVIGIAIGMLAAALLARVMASTLFGVTAFDSVAFSVGPLLLFFVASIACVMPARRAISISPADSLKAE